MYSEKVMDHFSNPRNVGEIEDANAVGQVGNPKCGDIMKIYMKIDNDSKVIEDVKFKTFGCGAAVATSSMATEMVKGKTIDGLPDLDVKLENAEWSIVEASNYADRDLAESYAEFNDSPIREAVKVIAEKNTTWKGRCSSLIQDAIEYNIPLTETAKYVGGFLHRHQGKFLKEDGIKIQIIDNGTGGKTYKICKSTVDTVDEDGFIPLMDYGDAYDTVATEGWLS